MKKKHRKFLHLLRKYQKEQTTPEQTRMMDIWYDSIDYDQKQSALDADPGIEHEIWDRIGQKRLDQPEAGRRRLLWRPAYLFRGVAAAVILLLATFLIYNNRSADKPVIAGIAAEAIAHLNTVTNDRDTSLTIALSDGSKCRLAAGSSLFYPSAFEDTSRVVYLKGEGYFEVEKDAGRPFLVYSDNIVTRVVGTSFTVKKLKGTSNIEVAVYSGKVIVEKTKKQVGEASGKSVLLTPNKKVTYLSHDDSLVPGLMDEPALLPDYSNVDLTETFTFREVAVSDILALFEKAYGVTFVVSSPEVKNCIVTADMSQDAGLTSKLEILCAAINADFEVRDNHIVISGPGCR
ncbi:FecR family protein [Dyadobacter endophyticus]|uniref:FecR family protein n=1 Tax=Dyadobacter TaxID=120831 RepID=UPI003CFB2B52